MRLTLLCVTLTLLAVALKQPLWRCGGRESWTEAWHSTEQHGGPTAHAPPEAPGSLVHPRSIHTTPPPAALPAPVTARTTATPATASAGPTLPDLLHSSQNFSSHLAAPQPPQPVSKTVLNSFHHSWFNSLTQPLQPLPAPTAPTASTTATTAFNYCQPHSLQVSTSAPTVFATASPTVSINPQQAGSTAFTTAGPTTITTQAPPLPDAPQPHHCHPHSPFPWSQQPQVSPNAPTTAGPYLTHATSYCQSEPQPITATTS